MKRLDRIGQWWRNRTSPKRGYTFWGWILVMAIAGVLVLLKHGDWLQSPNEFMLADSPDGFKNYMTSAWHVRHDSGYVHYGGMNFPFGEHVLFTDNQPMLSAAMQWWNRHVFDVSDRVVGIINVLQVLSIIFGAGVIYLLFRKLHIPLWYASIAALGIAFLSPQHNRFDGHFGLSHIWVLPMLLLLLCRYEERSSRRYESLMIGILILVSAQLHFYNLGVSAIFLGFYTMFQIVIDRSWRNIWTRASHLLVMIFLPFTLLNFWLHWSDYCPDRPSNPYGFTDYIGRWEGTFLPYDFFPMHQWINHHITKIRGLDAEAQAYVGLVAFVFTLWLIFKKRFRLFEPAWDEATYHRVHKKYLGGVLFAAFTTLLFGLGFPFSIKGFEWMVDYLGPIRQFRGLARFTWAFYYSINFLIFYYLWNKSQRFILNPKLLAGIASRSKKLAAYLPGMAKWSLALVPLMFLCWEAYYFQKNKPPHPVPNLALKSKVATSPDHWLHQVDFEQFQALMPLPYYHVGSENIWLDLHYPLFQKVQYTALQTGVPDMGVNMSRSAVSRMVKSMQFALRACEPPVLLSEFPDNRPIALMIEPTQWADVQQHYQHLLDKATPLYDGAELRILSLVPDSVRVWANNQARTVAQEIDRGARFSAGGPWSSDQTPNWFAHLSYDSLSTNRHHFQGKGGGEGIMGDTTWIWQNPIPKGLYDFSIWIKVDEDMGMTQAVKIVEKNSETGYEVSLQKAELRFYLRTIVNGWALFELPFEVLEPNSTLNIYLFKKNVRAPFWFDEVLIKEKPFNLYRREPGWVVRNNYWYKLPKD